METYYGDQSTTASEIVYFTSRCFSCKVSLNHLRTFWVPINSYYMFTDGDPMMRPFCYNCAVTQEQINEPAMKEYVRQMQLQVHPIIVSKEVYDEMVNKDEP